MIEQLTSAERDLSAGVLEDLMRGRSIEVPVVVVTAHPDDETLAMGGRLKIFKRLRLVQLTDGAPLCQADAIRAGFSSRSCYAAERESEAQMALAALGVKCARIRGGVPDQSSLFFIPELVRLLERELREAAVVFTHPYEGGHPDHDLAALVVQFACDRIRSTGTMSPARLEFASYHHQAGGLVTGRFWPDQACAELVVPLEDDARTLKGRALAKYRTQASVIEWFNVGEERYRPAPLYDFLQPPPPKIAHYDLFGWPITSAHWRDTAAALLAQETPL